MTAAAPAFARPRSARVAAADAPPRSPGSGRRQAGLLLAALALCPLAALLIGDDPAAPVARARALIELERALGAVGGLGGGVLESGHVLQSPYAALPSGHVAFALVAGAAFACWGDRAWLRALGYAYPPLVVAVTVVTGNHLLVDAVAAVAVAAVARGLAAGWPQRAVGRARQARAPRRGSAPPPGTVAGMPAARRP